MGLLDGEMVAATWYFCMSVYFVGWLGDEEVKVHASRLLSRWMWPCVYCGQPAGLNCVKNVRIPVYCHHSSFFLKLPLLEIVFWFFFIWCSRNLCVCVEPLSQNTVYPKTCSCNPIHIYPVVNLCRSLYHSTAVLLMCCWTHFRHWCWNPRNEHH